MVVILVVQVVVGSVPKDVAAAAPGLDLEDVYSFEIWGSLNFTFVVFIIIYLILILI